MSATMKDIAALAGTSPTTVSKILNGRPIRTTEETRRCVLEAARLLEYSPGHAAAHLRSSRTWSIAVMTPNISGSFFSKLTRQIINDLSIRGYDTILFDTVWGGHNELHFLYNLHCKAIDGAIIIPNPGARCPEFDKNARRILNVLDLPLVVVNSDLGRDLCPCVSTDFSQAGITAARYLRNLGHRHFAFLSSYTDPLRDSPVFRSFSETLRQENKSCDPPAVLSGLSTYQHGYGAAEEIRRLGATAVLAENDSLAIGLCAGLRSIGLNVPEELSVMGIDDVFVGRILDVPLTTIRQSHPEISAKAVELLLSQIDGAAPEPTESILIPPALIERATCSRMRGRGDQPPSACIK